MSSGVAHVASVLILAVIIAACGVSEDTPTIEEWVGSTVTATPNQPAANSTPDRLARLLATLYRVSSLGDRLATWDDGDLEVALYWDPLDQLRVGASGLFLLTNKGATPITLDRRGLLITRSLPPAKTLSFFELDLRPHDDEVDVGTPSELQIVTRGRAPIATIASGSAEWFELIIQPGESILTREDIRPNRSAGEFIGITVGPDVNQRTHALPPGVRPAPLSPVVVATPEFTVSPNDLYRAFEAEGATEESRAQYTGTVVEVEGRIDTVGFFSVEWVVPYVRLQTDGTPIMCVLNVFEELPVDDLEQGQYVEMKGLVGTDGLLSQCSVLAYAIR